ncbi:MAG: dethiobiotin synthase [Candidatus Pseudobacter hemicellulosilyticus]|uniref:ATP-dependent dethiobiotin synthetase BioD n=1 Tax=Candidatus Pseudobacter hemicellulosilyticus TaxID=3121375 RepID=A0AAJ6BDU5_9BACT|nr:MAG: dethiobiotin synthase [Pseudobacter sp.]
MQLFVTGIGTGVGKTMVSAILARALDADYWKPVQAGLEGGTDSEWVKAMLEGTDCQVHPESYRLQLPASPHIAARQEGIELSMQKICSDIPVINRNLIIEGAGGLLVPLNRSFFMADLARSMQAKLVLVSRNYLGSINHSLLTARVCREMGLPVIGWIFNDQYLDYEEEIVQWTGIPRIASIPFTNSSNPQFVATQAAALKQQLKAYL